MDANLSLALFPFRHFQQESFNMGISRSDNFTKLEGVLAKEVFHNKFFFICSLIHIVQLGTKQLLFFEIVIYFYRFDPMGIKGVLYNLGFTNFGQ